MDLANLLWRGTLCCDLWRPPHRDECFYSPDDLLDGSGWTQETRLDSQPARPDNKPAVDAAVFTGAGTVNTLKPGTSHTFSEYASQIFLPYIRTQLEHVKRLEVVWDEYRPGSLKAHACSMRGKGNYRHVELRIKYSSPKKLAGFP